jgi:hypothetical protein
LIDGAVLSDGSWRRAFEATVRSRNMPSRQWTSPNALDAARPLKITD